MKRILIVEDDTLLSIMYEKMFASEGYEVLKASDGQEGLDKTRTSHPDLILLDVMMPKLNGIEVLDAVKKDPETKAIPVVILTNLSGTADAEKALEMGAVKYIIKSEYKPKEVFDLVQETLKKDLPNEDS